MQQPATVAENKEASPMPMVSSVYHSNAIDHVKSIATTIYLLRNMKKNRRDWGQEDCDRQVDQNSKSIDEILKLGVVDIDASLADAVQELSPLLKEDPRNETKIQPIKIVLQFLLKHGANPEDIFSNPSVFAELDKTVPELIFNYHFLRAQKYLGQEKESIDKGDEKLEIPVKKSLHELRESLFGALRKAEPVPFAQNEVLSGVINLIIRAAYYAHDPSTLLVLYRVTEDVLNIRIEPVKSIDYVKSLERDREMMPIVAAPASAAVDVPPFVIAARDGKKETVAHYLALQGIRLPQRHKLSALYQAASQGHKEIVLMLIIQGGLTREEINDTAQEDDWTASSNHQTALDIAAANGHLDVVGLLVAYGAEIKPYTDNDLQFKDDDTSPLPFSALEYAAANNHRDIIVFLLKNGAQIGNALQIAISNHSQPDLAELFVVTAKQYGKINELNQTLKRAAKHCHLNTVMFLLNYVGPTEEALDAIAANFDDQDVKDIFSHLKGGGYKGAALVSAAKNRHLNTVMFLLKSVEPTKEALDAIAANFDDQDVKDIFSHLSPENKRLVLVSAAKNQHLNTVMLLLNSIEPTIEALEAIAANFDDKGMGEVLDAMEANFNSQEMSMMENFRSHEYREAAFRAAIKHSHFEVAESLLLKGVEIHHKVPESRGTLWINLVQEIGNALKNEHNQLIEENKLAWKKKLEFFLKHNTDPRILARYPKVLGLLDEGASLIRLTFNYLLKEHFQSLMSQKFNLALVQSGGRSLEEKRERPEKDQFKEMKEMLLNSLDNVQKPHLSFFPFRNDGTKSQMIHEIREICNTCQSVQEIEVLITMAREVGIKVVPKSKPIFGTKSGRSSFPFSDSPVSGTPVSQVSSVRGLN
ncbi:MAG: ankyrin containing protein [Gammaproteobacteria bacterium]|jgi:ankyrin repeat protein|nr:ankyrin containing protein [Gammaproteobacteria bacterium]